MSNSTLLSPIRSPRLLLLTLGLTWVSCFAPVAQAADEVTVAAYSRCKSCSPAPRDVQALNRQRQLLKGAERAYHSSFCRARNPNEYGDHPVNCVSWQQAKDYCVSRKARLPEELAVTHVTVEVNGCDSPPGDAPGGD